MQKGDKIYIAGHGGMVGSALVRLLNRLGFENLLHRSKQELDLIDQKATLDFFEREKPAYVFAAAARVGGIIANNTARAQFIYENLQIQNNLIHGAYKCGVTKLLFLGSSCIYPKHAPQPIKEDYLLTGALESTNEPYAIAKIAGIKLSVKLIGPNTAAEFIAVMPTNLYGPNDNFDLSSSHVLPALMRKFHEAKMQNLPSVQVWGSGEPRREFLHVDDLAQACVYLMQNYDEAGILNVGTGQDITIRELAQLIRNMVGYGGDIDYDRTKPDGTPRKLLDVSRVHSLGWRHGISLQDGIAQTYAWYKSVAF